MAVSYVLVNFTKKEVVSFNHVRASSARELAGNEASSAITTWYMLKNPSDRIAFVSDAYDDWPFDGGRKSDMDSYADATESTVSDLIAQGIIEDRGMIYVDESDPENVFIRDLRNIWSNGG